MGLVLTAFSTADAAKPAPCPDGTWVVTGAPLVEAVATPPGELVVISGGTLTISSGRTKPHGMGIGLATSRSIIAAHDGRLWAEATAGPGQRSRSPLPHGTLAAIEREAILRALRSANGMVGGARGGAAILGLKRTTLQARMQKLGIAPPRTVGRKPLAERTPLAVRSASS